MEKSSSVLDDGATSSYHTVFIDTSLDTRLVLIVSDSDTVSDLKKKIMDEHPLCFPGIGGINIHALKVKRRGYFYHLSDSVFVRSAFHGISKSWFLYVEASIVGEQNGNQHLGKPDAGDTVPRKPSVDEVNYIRYGQARTVSIVDDSSLPRVQRDWNAKQNPVADHNADNNRNVLPNNSSDPGLIQKHNLHSKEYEDSLRHTEHKEDSSRILPGDAQVDVSLEGSSKNGSVMKKRRKTKKRSKDEVHNHALKEDNASACVSDKDASQQDNVVPDNSLLNEDRGKVVTHNIESGSKDITHVPCRISSSDPNKRPGSEILMNEVLREETAAPGKHIDHEKCTSKNVVLKDRHGTSSEETSLGPTVKKRRKTVKEDDNKNSSKDERVFICASTKETSDTGISSQCSLGDKQKSANATLDHVSTEFLKADHFLTASPSAGNQKRKRKSSKSVSQVVTAVPSFAEHDRAEGSLDTERVHKNLEREPDAVVVSGQNVQAAVASEPGSISMKEQPHVPVQEEGGKNNVTSAFDGDARATDAVNVRNKSNSTEVVAVSAGERVRASEVQLATAAEGNYPLAVLEANNHIKDGVSRNENVIIINGQKLGNHHITSVAEERELSKNNDTNAMPLAKCSISNRGEVNMHSKVVVTTELVDANGNAEPGKSSKKRKKSKKRRDNVASGTEHTSSLVGISSPEPFELAHKDYSSDKSRKVEIFLSPDVGNKESKTTVNTSILANDRETDSVIQNVLESLQDISKNSVDAENRGEKSRKKYRRKRNSAAKNLPDFQTEDKDISCKNATPSVNDITEVEVDASSELTKKAKLFEASSEHQLNGSEWEHENKAAIETNPGGSSEGKAIQILNSNFLKNGSIDEANNHAEVSYESDRTIVNDNFVPSQHKLEIAASDEMLVEKMSKTKGSDNVVKAGKDKKKLNVRSNGPSPDLQGSLKLNENQVNGGEAQAFKSGAVEPERLLTKGNADKSELQAKKNLLEVPEEATRADAVSGSGMRARLNNKKETLAAASNSSSGSSKNLLPRSKRGNGHQSRAERRKISRINDNGEVVNSSKPKRSLLAKSGTIFKDDSDGSSDDENGPDNTDSSTVAPSDNSLSSNYSDGDSTARQSGWRKENARRNVIKSNSSVKLHTIIRSSCRYKASKLTASQSQLQETESQPLEIVPDSQAND